MFYSTRNITLAAYLLTEGLRLDRVDRVGYKQVTFVFQDPNYVAEKMDLVFRNGDADVNLKAFMTELNMLRDVIFKGDA